MDYKELLNEVRGDYYKMYDNKYSTLRILLETLSTWDQPDFNFSDSLEIKDNGDIYIQDIKIINIDDIYTISEDSDAIFIGLKEDNVIGNKRMVIVIEWNVGISQIYMDWLDDEYDEKGYIIYG